MLTSTFGSAASVDTAPYLLDISAQSLSFIPMALAQFVVQTMNGLIQAGTAIFGLPGLAIQTAVQGLLTNLIAGLT